MAKQRQLKVVKKETGGLTKKEWDAIETEILEICDMINRFENGEDVMKEFDQLVSNALEG